MKDRMAKRHLNKRAVQATLDEKAKPCPLKGNRNAFVENGRTGERGIEGEIEARRTRGLDLRRREQLNVKMSAWPPRSYYVYAWLRLERQGFRVSRGTVCRMPCPVLAHYHAY